MSQKSNEPHTSSYLLPQQTRCTVASSSSSARYCCDAQLVLHVTLHLAVLLKRQAGHDQTCNFSATALIYFLNLFLYSLMKHRGSKKGKKKCIGAEASLLGIICLFSSSLCCFCPVCASTASPGPARQNCGSDRARGTQLCSSCCQVATHCKHFRSRKVRQVILLTLFIKWNMQPGALQNAAAALSPRARHKGTYQRHVRALPAGQSPRGTSPCGNTADSW